MNSPKTGGNKLGRGLSALLGDNSREFSINDNNLHEYWEDAKKCLNSIEETKLFKKIREIIVKNERNLLLETLDKISSNEIDIDKPNQYDLSDSF